MPATNIIERSLQLAAECGSVEEVKQRLKREGYLEVDPHLSGRLIRSEICKRLDPRLTTYRKRKPAPDIIA
jgi:hypothetical protein